MLDENAQILKVCVYVIGSLHSHQLIMCITNWRIKCNEYCETVI